MGNSLYKSRPRKYTLFPEYTEEKMFIALCLGFQEYSAKSKIKRGDTVLYIGQFDLEELSLLPPCTLIIVDPSSPPSSPLLPYTSSKEEGESAVKCLRIRSNYPNFLSLFLAALQEYQINGLSLERLKDILNSTILSWAYNGGTDKKFVLTTPFSPAFYMEANSPQVFTYTV